MHAEYLLVHNGGDGQAVEAVRERLPQLDVVPALALVVESWGLVEGSGEFDWAEIGFLEPTAHYYGCSSMLLYEEPRS